MHLKPASLALLFALAASLSPGCEADRSADDARQDAAGPRDTAASRADTRAEASGPSACQTHDDCEAADCCRCAERCEAGRCLPTNDCGRAPCCTLLLGCDPGCEPVRCTEAAQCVTILAEVPFEDGQCCGCGAVCEDGRCGWLCVDAECCFERGGCDENCESP